MTQFQQSHPKLVTTEHTPVEYSSPERQGHSEYDPRQMLEIVNPEHQLKELPSSESENGQYEELFF